MIRLLLFVMPIAMAGASPLYGDDPRSISSLRLADAVGKQHTRDEWTDKSAVVFFFLATECPAVNGYAPSMERIAKEYGKRGATVYGIHCDSEVTAEIARQHAKEFGLTFPILLDPEQSLARQTGVTRTATAVVADREGRILYRGRIDDRFPAPGKRRDDPRTHELEDALKAVLVGTKPSPSETEVVGCLLPKSKQNRKGDPR